jgi:hypothetical protein
MVGATRAAAPSSPPHPPQDRTFVPPPRPSPTATQNVRSGQTLGPPRDRTFAPPTRLSTHRKTERSLHRSTAPPTARQNVRSPLLPASRKAGVHDDAAIPAKRPLHGFPPTSPGPPLANTAPFPRSWRFSDSRRRKLAKIGSEHYGMPTKRLFSPRAGAASAEIVPLPRPWRSAEVVTAYYRGRDAIRDWADGGSAVSAWELVHLGADHASGQRRRRWAAAVATGRQ